MAKKKYIHVWRRITNGQLLGYLRSRAQIYAALHNIHPNSDESVVVRMDAQHFDELLEEARQCLISKNGLDFVDCICGMLTDEEILLRLMRGHYQCLVKQSCDVYFYIHDRAKEIEVNGT